jgi:LuxR family maltose regulon positive regulatory protein
VLFERLAGAGRVTLISAPAGSGKTMLLRSWIAGAGLVERVGWVTVPREQRDAQRSWISVLDALRATTAGAALVQPLTAAPELDGWAIVERLLADLGALQEPLWLVLDDLHELRSTEAMAQLELLLLRAPAHLQFVLATRRDLRLGLHRLRLEGELSEFRAADLRFTLEEARALLAAAGVVLSEAALGRLVERTEGWAAGLRLATLSLSGHPDPERFAAEFSGSERTVTEYLVAEVLERQPEEVRRLLLRTSILERLSGPLADLLTGGSGGERILQELEKANAFVVALDAGRSWFRYHHLFAELLQLGLRRTALAEVPGLHGAAASWFAEHGYPIEAVRHAQAAENWPLAARLLADHWGGLYLGGQSATAHELLAAFPAGAVAADAELTSLRAADELTGGGSLLEAERYLALADEGAASVPADRRERFQLRLVVLGLTLARQRSDLPAVLEEAQRLLAPTEATGAAAWGVGDHLHALVLINLGIAEVWTARLDAAERHLEQAAAMAHRIERPFLEVTGLAHSAMVASLRSFPLAAQRSRRAIELARRHGWTDAPIAGVAYAVLGGTLIWQGRFEEGERWLEHAERVLHPEAEPAAGLLLHHVRGALELARGRHQEALAAFRTAEPLSNLLVSPHALAPFWRPMLLHILVRLGETDRVEQTLAELDQQERNSTEMRIAQAHLRLAQHDPQAATIVLAPVLDNSASATTPHVTAPPAAAWLVQALLLEAIARDALGDPAAAGRALERALDLAEPDRALISFLVYPAPGLLERHARQRTAHADLIADILSLLAGTSPPGAGSSAAPPGQPRSLREPLSRAETRVLRYLPTNLTVPEIAGQLYLSANTVRTHMRHLYDKLGAHRRHEAVDRARALGLLAPSARRP